MMADAQCRDNKPVRYETCMIRNVCPQWKSEDWSPVGSDLLVTFYKKQTLASSWMFLNSSSNSA